MSGTDPIADLLALEREYDDLPAGAEARMLDGIERSIAGGAGPDGGDGGDDGGGGSAPGTPGGETAARAARVAPWLARAAYVAVGVAVGATGHAVLAPASPAPAASALVALAPAGSAAGVPSLSPPAAAESVVRVSDLPVPVAPVVSGSSGRPAPSASARHDEGSVAAERLDLDVARAALARGRVDACLEAIERHSRTHGEGHFAEEREVLAIQALAAAARDAEARARAQRFHAKYPTSLFGQAVDQSLTPSK